MCRLALGELERLDQESVAAGAPASPGDLRTAITTWVVAYLDDHDVADADDRTRLGQMVMTTCFRSSRLRTVWSQYPDASNLSVYGAEPARLETGPGEVISLEPIVRSPEELRRNIMELAAEAGESGELWDPRRPELGIILDDGTRVTAIDWVTPKPFVTLRRPTYAQVTLDDLVANDTMTKQCRDFLAAAVRARLRILVAGSMNSGKTVLLRAFGSALPKTDAVMVAEAQPELRLEHGKGIYPALVVPLTARRARSDPKFDVTVRSLIEMIQRMTPSVVIIGEVRGEEAVALGAALGQGYQVLSTIHADSAAGAVRTAAMYYREATGCGQQSALELMAGVDIAVHMTRHRDTNKRILGEIAAVGELDSTGELAMDMIFAANTDFDAARVPERWASRLHQAGWDSLERVGE